MAKLKQEVMRTGGGMSSVTIPEDPEMDSLGVNIEMQHDAIDSDTLLAGSSSYAVVCETSLATVPTDESEHYCYCDNFSFLDGCFPFQRC